MPDPRPDPKPKPREDPVDLQQILKEYPELLYAILAVLSYIASVFFAVREFGSAVDLYGVEIHAISTPLWLIFGVMALYFLYAGFFDMWIYAIHLIFAYYLTGAGILGLSIFYDDINWRVFSVILTGVGFGFVAYFVFRIGNVRSYRVVNSMDPVAARDRFSLGMWYLFPFLFFIIAVLSFYDLALWYDDPGHTPYLHVIMELALILTVVYILWQPENVLFFGTGDLADLASFPEIATAGSEPLPGGMTDPAPAGAESQTVSPEGPLGALESRLRRKRTTELCPGFDTPAVPVQRICPGCNSANSLLWCPQSEEFLVPCPSCRRQTYHGRKVCIHCRSRLSEEITCSSCGKHYPVRRFREPGRGSGEGFNEGMAQGDPSRGSAEPNSGSA